MSFMARSLNFKYFLQLLREESAALSSPLAFSSRRDFLKKAALGGAATATLAGCSNFDRWVRGDNHQLDHEVMVLGGGLAGLAAAYQLKRNKTPYQLFEGSSRLGGRIQTLFQFNPDGQFAELGGEFFDGGHKTLLQLCKDLSLNAQEITYDNKSDHALYWISGKVMSEKDFRKKLRPLAIRLAQTRQELFASIPTELTPRALILHPPSATVDNQSLADFLNALKPSTDFAILNCFENICVSEWGVEAKDINFLQFLVRLDFEERTGITKLYRVEGGTSRLIDVLGERVQGIVPGTTLKVEHRLVAIRGKSNGFECTFRTPNGSDVVWARQIICTLPWSTLKDVDGIQSLELNPLRKELISKATYATHAKVATSFRDAFWRKKQKAQVSYQGILRGELLGQNYWDTSRNQEGTHGVLTSQRGGSRGQNTGVNASAETLQDLRNFFKEVNGEENSQVANWSQKPFAKGSRYNVPPGGYLKYLEMLSGDPEAITFYFAGEHMSFHDFGTMNGALETGIAVADIAMQKAFLKGYI